MTDTAPIEITMSEYAAWRNEARPHVLVDVREPWEIEIASVEGALNIPLQQLPARAAELPKDEQIVVMCHHGGRSMMAVQWLRREGFMLATNLAGGIDSYARQIDPAIGVY